ncbi:Protein kinase domain and AGC-kinase [Trichostrongylus colubriformis]|uniref:non-specific serine/threonine protein kinase n=1 Tax=Trichostrongylus colubriformis TaxID=6319 RepID=A0AAN8IEJ3_TRICO
MRANGHDRHRNDTNLQDVRVGRHRDKLELIRDSLRPFEQTVNEVPTQVVDQTTSSAVDSTAISQTAEQQRAMVDSLIAQGYEQDAAFYALKLVKFASPEAAIDVLKHINHDHANMEETKNDRLLLLPSSAAPLNGNLHVQTSRISNGASNGNLYPMQFVNVEDSTSSRSTSPLPPQMPSPSGAVGSYVTSGATGAGSGAMAAPTTTSSFAVAAGPSTTSSPLSTSSGAQTAASGGQIPSSQSPHKALRRQYTPAAPDYHRTHVHISTSPYKSDFYQQQNVRPQQTSYKPSIFIERGPERPIGVAKQHYVVRDTFKTALDTSMSAPIGQSTSHVQIGGISSHLGRYGQQASHPVIRTTFSAAPLKSMVNINVSPINKNTDARTYRLDVTGRDGGVSSVHGIPGSVTGVQNIIVDPDKTHRGFIGYEDELRPKHAYVADVVPSTSKEQPVRHERLERSYGVGVAAMQQHPPTRAEPATQPAVTRCTSPLPESIASRLKQQKYEKYVKPCKPRMFCFFMEQHVERLLAQYKERMKRAHQLQREMEAANLTEPMKQKMMDFLQQKESRYMRLRRQKMNKDMFEVLQHIGVGAFGRVSLVKKKDSGQVYAMKSLLKKDVIMKQQAAHVKAERDILAEADSPWIVKLFFSFQDDRCLYFVMEYVPGGDMMQLLINKGIFEEKLARFYIAELTCAIDYVHSLGFIHRDIKPDNILIDQQGHIKLTDFGLCTGLRWTHDRRYYGPENVSDPSHVRVDSFSLPAEVAAMEQNMKVLNVRHQKKRDQAHSVVGTGNYMAPEVILKIGHTQLCDWWSVGVILYEMVFGRPPFMSMTDDPKETQYKIVNWSRYLDVSPRAGGGHLSRDCIMLIQRLCCDRNNRIGTAGAREVMDHPWFRGIDFKNLRSTRAEFIPRVEHAEDTSNFEAVEISESPFETLGKRAPNNPAFYEFTFRHFFDTDGQGCPSLRPPQKRPPLAPLFEGSPRHETVSSSESIVI